MSDDQENDLSINLEHGIHTRGVALDILNEVLLHKNPLDQVLSRHKEFNMLEGRERNLARMIVATCLRHKGQMDDLITCVQDKPQEISPPYLKLILYVGITQLLFMNVPDHAAVDTTVTLAEESNLGKQKGFVNAILRRIGREGNGLIAKHDPVQMNMPSWLITEWVADYGLKIAAEIAQASLTEASLDISVTKQEELDYWANELGASLLPTGSLRLQSGGGAIPDFNGFDDGQWWVQDASAALPVYILGNDLRGKKIIDLCAAPGGKTAQLAARGAEVTALDRSAKRLEILKENIARLKFEDKVDVVVGDGSVWQPAEPVDVVLLDAPCSATGTIRRHPDILHLKTDKDVAQLQSIQARLLENSAAMLKSGGTLIYCTCSLQKSEGEAQVDKFLEAHSEFSRVPITADEVGGIDTLISDQGDVRVLPFHLAPHGGMDGFYVARLVKG